MANTFSSLSTTCLTETSFIGGSYKELSFKVYDASASPIDITSFTYRWILSPYGQPETSSIVKDGIFDPTDPDNNKFKVYLYSYDTVNLSGKYIQQPIIVGSPGYEFRMGQGYVNITPAASLTTVEDTQTLEQQIIIFTQEVSGSFVVMQQGLNETTASMVNNYAATSASIVADRVQLTALSASAVSASGSLTGLSASAINLNIGWVAENGTWTYISASAVAVPSDATTRFSVGDKVKFTLDAATRYYYVTGVPSSTVLYLTGGSNYTISASPITLPYYSKMETPVGFPQYFDYTPVGVAATNVSLSGRFSIQGRTVRAIVHGDFTGAITFTAMPTLPVLASANILDSGSSLSSVCGVGSYTDFGTATVGNGILPSIRASGSVVFLVKASDSSLMSATVPITWANGDMFYTQFSYEI